MLTKNVLVPIAGGIEEIEAVTIIDILRRAKVSVRVCTIEDREITGAHGIKIVADSEFVDEVLNDYDAIVLPGGTEGAQRFFAHGALGDAIKNFVKDGNLVAAICASPAIVLAGLGILNNKKATCYPAFKDRLSHYVDEKVVIDGNIVTSQGPATALPFALRLVEILVDKKTADSIKEGVLA